MHTEIEAKWLNIDFDEFRRRLGAAGAVRVSPERLMRRANYDYPDKRLYTIGGWVRVRDEGDKVTMSYKQVNDRTLHGTKEINVTVDDFETASQFVETIGLKRKSYQETKRESWKLGDTEIELDTWPWIPGFVELEAKDEAALREAAESLGLAMSDALHGSVEVAYQDKYDVSELEIDSWTEIVFSEVPDSLKSKAR